MILKDNFYTIKSKTISDGKAEFRVKLNAENFVYQAHFPNNPITPGVCLVQMTAELFGSLKDERFNIKMLKNVKFIAPINPLEYPEVDFLFDFAEYESLWQVKVSIKYKETVFTKMTVILAANSRII